MSNRSKKAQSLSPTRNRLSPDLIVAIHQSLVPPKCHVCFKDISDRNTQLYGHEGTKERRSTTNKRHFLSLLRKNNFVQFRQSCNSVGVSCPSFFDPDTHIFYDTEEEFATSKEQTVVEEAKQAAQEATRALEEAKRAEEKVNRLKFSERMSNTNVVSKPYLLKYNGETDEENGGEDFKVMNILYPEKNDGIFPIMANDVVVGKERMSCLSILLPLLDPRNLKSSHCSARLLEDFSGIVITQPTVPYFLIHSMHALHNLKKETCEQTKLQHDVVGTAIQEDMSRQTKTTVWKFPGQTRCSNEYFNDNVRAKTSTQYNLKPYSRFLYQQYTVFEGTLSEKTLKWHAPYVLFKVSVIGTVQNTHLKDNDTEDLLQTAFQGLSFHGQGH